MTTRTDNDLRLKLYRSYVMMSRRLAEDDQDLDRRFDKIMDDIDRQNQPAPIAAAIRRLGDARHAAAETGRRLIASKLVKSAAGLGMAIVTATTRVVAGVINVMSAATAGAATALAVTALTDRFPARRRRARRRERDTIAPTPAE
ncbi:hypothetical protein QF035_011209 [Streptomyces umbrinus]|uniref:Integral membrane protein n=1 Tax=Streptomyces umbrinus TaxID=67370 RepID=A0ABU0TCP9_9ACTN|nr:hypothetical protein [Streptomyces umbrinus]MDQ1033540.1 hypothetical protein [Streptomyces umbrinus]